MMVGASAPKYPQLAKGPLLLDSADLGDVRQAAQLGYVSGVTTNPKLLTVSDRSPLEHIQAILDSHPTGAVYHQLQAEDDESALREAMAARELFPSRIVLKVHATPSRFCLASRLVAEGMTVAMTAIYSPAQYLLSHAVGAAGVIAYVDRSARLEPQEEPVVRRLSKMRDRMTEGPLIIAASVKSPEQAAQAIVEGAHIVTAPLNVLLALGEHPLSDSALDEFMRAPSCGSADEARTTGGR